jgi:hypothetical protein
MEGNYLPAGNCAMASHLFISHSSQDDGDVKRLREILEAHGLTTWVDSRRLSGGDSLWTEVEAAIRSARQFLVVVTVKSLASKWVKRETRLALELAQERKDGFKVISVVMPGVDTGFVGSTFSPKTTPTPLSEQAERPERSHPRHLRGPGGRTPQRPATRRTRPGRTR